VNNSYFESSLINEHGDGKGHSISQFLSPPHHLQDHSKSFNSYCCPLTLLYNDFSFVFIEKDMIPISGIKEICSIFDKSHITFSSYFTTTKKFHDINTFNDNNEINKYLVNDVNIINFNIDSIESWNGEMSDSERVL